MARRAAGAERAAARAATQYAAAQHAIGQLRRAAALADAIDHAVDHRERAAAATGGYDAQQRQLATRLGQLSAALTPGWLGADLHAAGPLPALGTAGGPPTHVRIGMATPVAGAAFPLVAPAGLLTVDVGGRDPRSAGLIQSVVLRLLASAPPGTLRLRPVDGTARVFGGFEVLVPVGLSAPVATDAGGLRAALAAAEEWVRTPAPAGQVLLLAIAAIPDRTGRADLDRLAALARVGSSTGLYVVAAGWSPKAVGGTRVSLQGQQVTVGGELDGLAGTAVVLDPAPAPETIAATCSRIAGLLAGASSTLLGLLAELPWREDSTDALEFVAGRAGTAPVTLRLNDFTAHWLIGGAAGSGKSAFLTSVLIGLCYRYGPEELGLYLISNQADSWMPHVRGKGHGREHAIAMLRELESTVGERIQLCAEAGVAGYSQLRTHRSLPRLLYIVDDTHTLVPEQTADDEFSTLLESVARTGRRHGVHVIVSGQRLPYGSRHPVLAQFPIRIALPGGDFVLDESNHIARSLPVGAAVVNTAGGLGGPNRAVRAHERLFEFGDPYGEPELVATIRQRLWAARPAASVPNQQAVQREVGASARSEFASPTVASKEVSS
jgi:DNA segregation ATPase FtsK/SpoIIIE, S-DNA-T family